MIFCKNWATVDFTCNILLKVWSIQSLWQKIRNLSINKHYEGFDGEKCSKTLMNVSKWHPPFPWGGGPPPSSELGPTPRPPKVIGIAFAMIVIDSNRSLMDIKFGSNLAMAGNLPFHLPYIDLGMAIVHEVDQGHDSSNSFVYSWYLNASVFVTVHLNSYKLIHCVVME